MKSDIYCILVRPQMGENIGAAARVMKNFGLTQLRIVAPRDGWPNPAAEAMAAGGADIVAAASLYDTLAEAVADLTHIYATTARERAMHKPVFTPRAWADQIPQAARIGLLFGPERSGLENEDLAYADAVISVPVNPDYPSLNLAQCVAILAYEISQHDGQGLAALPSPVGESAATKAEIQGLFDQLEAALDARHFWKVEAKKPIMWRNIRNLFQRASLSEQEVNTLRGIIRCLCERE